MGSEVDPQLRKLYPSLSDEELLEVEQAFDDYLEIALRIYERTSADPEAHARLQELLRAARKQDRGGGGKADGPAGTVQSRLPF